MFKMKMLAVLTALMSVNAAAQGDAVLNLYSARHYQSDEALYENFTAKTGIRINRIEGDEQALLERILNEGENSPADVLITVDAARLAKAEAYGVFALVDSEFLKAHTPTTCRWSRH